MSFQERRTVMKVDTTAAKQMDVRAGIYRVIAAAEGLLILAVGFGMLAWPFGWFAVAPEGLDPEPVRWYAGMFAATMSIFLAAPILATLRRPRERAGLVQYAVAGMGVVSVGSLFVYGFDLSSVVMVAVLIAAYPAPGLLLRFTGVGVDRVLMGATLIAVLALVPFVQDTVRMNASDAGSYIQEDGIYWSALWLLCYTVVGGTLASLRVRGWQILLSILGAGFVYLGAASIAVPDHAGSWGYGMGIVAITAGSGAIVYARRAQTSKVTDRAPRYALTNNGVQG
jgi:hypothetical protein